MAGQTANYFEVRLAIQPIWLATKIVKGAWCTFYNQYQIYKLWQFSSYQLPESFVANPQHRKLESGHFRMANLRICMIMNVFYWWLAETANYFGKWLAIK